MRCVIRRFRSHDAQAYFDQICNAGQLSLGRGTDQQIQLEGLTVALAHATLEASGRDRFLVESSALSGVLVDGVPTRSIELRFGDSFELGGYRFLLLQPDHPDFDLFLEVLPPPPAPPPPRIAELSLSGRLSRRRWAWGLLACVLVLGLLLPILSRFAPPQLAGLGKLPVLSHQMWNTGEISNVHKFFATDCARCHQDLFVATRDSACLDCHADVQHHVAPAARTHPAWDALTCTSCHREHQGAEGVITRSNKLCTDCHAQPQAVLASSALAVVKDFARSHPEFSPIIGTRQARWTPSLRDDSGLLFSHSVHLTADGVAGPAGREKLECGSCHRRGAGDAQFEPLNMRRDCQHCHDLRFDPEQPEAVLPHGDVALIRDTIRSHFEARALRGEFGPNAPQAQARPRRLRNRSEPAAPGAAPSNVEAWVREQTARTSEEVFRYRLCAKCHEPAQIDSGQWTIAPVMAPRQRLESAEFTHHPHRSQSCDLCHAAQHSDTARDLLLPGIDTCRECHRDPDSHGGLPSDCMSCHRMHRADRGWHALN